MTTLIPRPHYTERIAPFIGKNIIKVLTGQRRIGKSFILRQVMEEIRRKEPEAAHHFHQQGAGAIPGYPYP